MAALLLASTRSHLDLRDLVRALERSLAHRVEIRAVPGLLAPDGEATARDAARARGDVVAVVAPADDDLVSHALLTVEAARAAGLVAPAAIVAGEGAHGAREQLARLGRVEVVAAADLRAPSEAVSGWDVEAWLGAEPEASASGGVALAPYSAWDPGDGVPDPREAGRFRLTETLGALVTAEGPVKASRAFGLYVKASGGHKVTTIARAPLSGAAYRMRQAGALAIDDDGGEEVLRLPDQPAVRLRELGPRTLDEVPTAELAELLRRLRAAGTAEDDLDRAALDALGLRRMTTRATALLAAARERL